MSSSEKKNFVIKVPVLPLSSFLANFVRGPQGRFHVRIFFSLKDMLLDSVFCADSEYRMYFAFKSNYEGQICQTRAQFLVLLTQMSKKIDFLQIWKFYSAYCMQNLMAHLLARATFFSGESYFLARRQGFKKILFRCGKMHFIGANSKIGFSL